MSPSLRVSRIWIPIVQRGSEIQPFEIQTFLRSVLKWLGSGYSSSPNHLKTGPFLSGFQLVFDKMAAICPDLEWRASGFRISDSIQNLDHLQPNLFLTIQDPD